MKRNAGKLAVAAVCLLGFVLCFKPALTAVARFSGSHLGARGLMALATFTALIGLATFVLVVALVLLRVPKPQIRRIGLGATIVELFIGVAVVVHLLLSGALMAAYAGGVAERIQQDVGPGGVGESLRKLGAGVAPGTMAWTNFITSPFATIFGAHRVLITTGSVTDDDVMVSGSFQGLDVVLGTGPPQTIGATWGWCRVPLGTNAHLIMVGH
jgi:hypothetical protein